MVQLPKKNWSYRAKNNTQQLKSKLKIHNNQSPAFIIRPSEKVFKSTNNSKILFFSAANFRSEYH